MENSPSITPLVANVSEEGLTGGLSDNLPAGIDTTDSTTASGTVNIFDPDGDPITSVTLVAPPDGTYTSGGSAVSWSGSGTSLLTGTANGVTVASLSIDNAGNYQFELMAPLDHVGDAGQEGVLQMGFGVSATAGGLTTTAPAAISINVEDDAPAVIAPTTELLATLDSNVLIMLDVSGSMSEPDGVNGSTRLESAITSINTLLDRYEDRGDVTVRLVTFSSNAQEQGSQWMSVANARTVLNTLNTGGWTNYDAALQTAQGAFSDAGSIVGAQNVAYFFSDGDPTRPTDSVGINASEESDWQNFLVSNQIKSFAIGMGGAISTTTPLDPIAFDGQGARDMDALLVSDFDQLDDVLASTMGGFAVGYLHSSGTVGAGSLFGADGGYIESVTSEGTLYTYDPVADAVSVSGTDRSVFDPATDTLTITTTNGGVLSIDMVQGAYSYSAPSDVPNSSAGTTIDYVAVDADGDPQVSTVTIEVESTTVTIDSGTFSGTAGPDLLIGRPTNLGYAVTGSVAAGNTYSAGTEQFGFSFDSGEAGVSVTRIVIDLRAGTDGNAIFDTSGSGSFGPALGTLIGLAASDVTFSPASGETESPTLTIDFAPGSFAVGDEIRFGVDTDSLGNNLGSAFASAGVAFTVTLSDGSSSTVTYGSDGANGSVATATVDVASEGVTIDGGAGDDLIIGTDLADVLAGGDDHDQIEGGAGLDILVGGSGDDILIGGTEADTFQWGGGDEGAQGAPALDVVTDFNLSDSDALDLADLLSGEEGGDLTDYLRFEQDGANAVVHVSSSGGFDAGYVPSAEDQTILLENVDLTALGATDQQIIDALLAGNNLITGT